MGPPTRSAIKTPGQGGGKLETEKIALASAFSALYAALVYAFAGLSFQLVQVRVADALIPLSMIFGWPVTVGVTLGCTISNVISPMPSVITDITFGSLANFIASLLAWKTNDWKRNRTGEILGCSVATTTITLIVGTYLAVMTEMPYWVWWLSILAGSVISINVLGYALIQVLKKWSKRLTITG